MGSTPTPGTLEKRRFRARIAWSAAISTACGRGSRTKYKQACTLILACGHSSIWLERFPVTEEVAGSSPVGSANVKELLSEFFLVATGLEPERGSGKSLGFPVEESFKTVGFESAGPKPSSETPVGRAGFLRL